MSKHRILEISQSVVLSAVMLVLIFAGSSSVLAAGSLPAVYKENAGTVSVEVDPRVELIGIVFRLAGNPEYNIHTYYCILNSIDNKEKGRHRRSQNSVTDPFSGREKTFSKSTITSHHFFSEA
jgi:hypothetical protein